MKINSVALGCKRNRLGNSESLREMDGIDYGK